MSVARLPISSGAGDRRNRPTVFASGTRLGIGPPDVLDCLDASSPSGASALASPEAPYGRTGGLSFPARGHLTNKRLSRRFTRRGAVTWIAGTIEIRSMLGAELREPLGRATEESKVRGIANLKANHRDLAVRISDRQS